MRLIDADQAVSEADRLLEHYNLAMANAENNREINHVFKRQELFKAVRAVVNACPTQDPAKHGYWIDTGRADYYLNKEYRCSCCNSVDYLCSPYCYNCGAKMDSEHKGE